MSVFNPDSDVNFKLWKSTRGGLSAEEASHFDEYLMQNLCLQHTDNVTVSNATFATSVQSAKDSAHGKKRKF